MKKKHRKTERVERNRLIRRLFFRDGWTLKRIKEDKRFSFKSEKSVWAIVYPERFNAYQKARYNLLK